MKIFRNWNLDWQLETIVLWNDIDRVVKDFNQVDSSNSKFNHYGASEKHLRNVFHKFIEQGKINIYFQE